MSSSDAGPACDVGASIARIARSASGGASVSERDLTELVSAAVKLYAAAVEREGAEPPPVDRTVGTTEAMVLACALVRSQDLNPFDLALWFAHTEPKPPHRESSPA